MKSGSKRLLENMRLLNDAYMVLGVTRNDIEKYRWKITPKIQRIFHMLRSRGVKETPAYYLGLSESTEASLFLDLYYSFPETVRDLIPYEAYCIAKGISTLRLLEALTTSVVRASAQSSAIISAALHPFVTEGTIDLALNAEHEGTRLAAQTVVHKATGYLPMPKGSQTTVNITANANATAAAQSAVVAAPPPEQTIRRAVDRFNEGHTVNILPVAPQPDLPDRMPYENAVAVESNSDDDDSI